MEVVPKKKEKISKSNRKPKKIRLEKEQREAEPIIN